LDKAKGVGETPRPLPLVPLFAAGLHPFLAMIAGISTADPSNSVRSSRSGAKGPKQVAKVPFEVEKLRCNGGHVSL
jgi:hypothetical protein